MSRIGVLVVDDEPLAREMLVDMVESDSELEVVGEAGDGRAALALIKRLSPEIVLLDIEMPERDGLEAVRQLSPADRPCFIFVTAYEEYAGEAFEVEAVDYVLKPVSQQRLARALARTKRRLRERRLTRVAEEVVSLTAGINPGGRAEAATSKKGDPGLTRIPVTVDGRTRFIESADIIWLESQDYYVKIHSRRHGGPLLRTSLKSLKQRLNPRRFCEVRRGAVVNIDYIEEVQTLFKGARAVVLKNGKKLRVSRTCWRKLREVLAPFLSRNSQ